MTIQSILFFLLILLCLTESFLYRSFLWSKLDSTRIRLRPAETLSDGPIDIDKPRVNVKSYEEVSSSDSRIKAYTRVSTHSTNAFGNFSLKTLTTETPSDDYSDHRETEKAQDHNLNGIQPWAPFLFSVVAAGLSAGGWTVSSYMAEHFAVKFVHSDIYQVQRAAIIGRNLVVGIGTLFTGFSAVIAVGLVMLGVVVTVGVLKGELDPNADS